MLIFALLLIKVLIMNFLRVIHLPYSLSQNIVQLANPLRFCMPFSLLGPEFMREPDDDILPEYYYGLN